ncbi:proton-conducting transporter membrane subunit [Bremerella sp. JC817]|uniref:proton-conducting transporter transmembrane domain-containing protein n=1 Tax=Bremerella sp. JC817 TaxID=3231756 RepID=UPI0034594762
MSLLAMLICVAPFCLAFALVIPSAWANHHADLMRRLCQASVAGVGAFLMLASLGLLFQSNITGSWSLTGSHGPLRISVYYDVISALMALLIGYIGWIISRFSGSYLDRDSRAGQFDKWLMVCLGAILGLVVSGNLIQLFVFWILTTFALHQLLMHNADRPWAVWTARKKFLISRLGDVFLGIAIYLVYQVWGTGELSELLAKFKEGAPALFDDSRVGVICILLVLSALTKSAQFPFHSWLPDTLETPTPVSALMHAGIINGGGFLLIRLSPLVSQSSAALALCTIIGGVTCLLGGIIMSTQSSIKRKLAYSTMSQMGFMMMQCGLGAFSIALIHIISHSLYKSHAFLRSGSAVTAPGLSHSPISWQKRLLTTGVGLVSASIIIVMVAFLMGVDGTPSMAEMLLGLVTLVALTHLISEAISSGSPRLALIGMTASTLIVAIYFLSHAALDGLTRDVLAHDSVGTSLSSQIVIGIVAIGFVSLGIIEIAKDHLANSRILQLLYVHAVNGFYFDIAARRLTALLWARSAPTP